MPVRANLLKKIVHYHYHSDLMLQYYTLVHKIIKYWITVS